MFARHRSSSFVPLLLLTCCAVSPVAFRAQDQTPDRAQVSITSTPDNVPALSDRARKQLQEKLESAAATPLQVVDVDGAPLEINGPKATSLRIEGNCDLPANHRTMINDYVVKLRLKLVNRTGQLITGAGLEFTNTQENNTFYVYPKPVQIEPGKSQKLDVAFMTVTGDPAYLSVKLAGASFASGDTWEGFPFPKVYLTGRSPQSLALTPGPVPQVDSRPKVLNRTAPRYTEEARRNHVTGAAVLGLLVGTDGAVKQAKVMNALPDGLTEQAILACYQMKFEPARKNGEPVEYWLMKVMVEFNLR